MPGLPPKRQPRPTRSRPRRAGALRSRSTDGADSATQPSASTISSDWSIGSARRGRYAVRSRSGSIRITGTQGSPTSPLRQAEFPKILDSYTSEASTLRFSSLEAFGDDIIALTSRNTLVVLSCETLQVYVEIEFKQDAVPVAFLHPVTYLNKILVAFADGSMQLWNIKTRYAFFFNCNGSTIFKPIHASPCSSLIYSFKSFEKKITCLVQAPVLDVIAVGFADGTILLHNLRLDQSVLGVNQNRKVTSISFRTDGMPIMASSNDDGDVIFWDLERFQIAYTLQSAHDKAISKIQFLSGQPIIVTSGCDNSIKEWIFDSSDGSARLLRSRSGHTASPTKIFYTGRTSGQRIYSAGSDGTFRMFSCVKDSKSLELSQGALQSNAKKYGLRAADLRLAVISTFSICKFGVM